MKKLIPAVLLTLLLAGCAVPAQDTPPDPESALSAQSSAEAGTSEVFQSPGGQQMAMEAHEAIMEAFGVGTLPGVSAYEYYPEEFADAYIGEDDFLYVCLTDTSEEMLSHYRGLVPDYRILRFVEVEHSYQKLYALQMALTELEELEFSSIGIDVKENEVDIGIPDITKEEADRILIREHLPQEVKNLFEELPIAFAEEAYLVLT